MKVPTSAFTFKTLFRHYAELANSSSDTDSFIIGMSVYVDGVKPGRIQFIGETKFGPGEWAGVFLDEPIGKNDGSVMSTRYFTCEPRHGVFSRLYRLTREPIEGADEILNQCRR